MTATRRSDLPERAGFVFQQYVRIAAARPSIARAVFGLVLRGMMVHLPRLERTLWRVASTLGANPLYAARAMVGEPRLT